MLISNMMLFNKLKKAAMVKNPATSTTTAPKKVVVRRVPITTNLTKPPSVIARLQPSSRLINNSTGTISTRAPHLLSSSSTTATAAITTDAATISTTDDSDFVVANQSSVEDDLSPQASPTLCSSRIDEQLTEQPSFHGVLIDSVRNYECLWQITSTHFKDKNMRQRAWLEISEALGQEGEYIFL